MMTSQCDIQTSIITSRCPPPTSQSTPSNDSFDRFGDDLCRLLLSYLTLEDRFRYECLSRLWRRSVFSGQRELVVDWELVDKWSRRSRLRRQFYDFQRLAVLTTKCCHIRSVKLMCDGIDPAIVDRIMDLVVNNSADRGRLINSLEIQCCQTRLPPDLRLLIHQISKFQRLTRLVIDCRSTTPFISSNPCADVLPKMADKCPDIRQLSIRVHCFDRSDVVNIVRDVQLFPRLADLQLALYTTTGDEQVSVQSLANCPGLRHLSLECLEDMDFADVDKVNRQLKRPASVTKVDPQQILGL